MYWNILVWLRIEIPDGFLHQIPENLKIDDLVTGGTINLQLTPEYGQRFKTDHKYWHEAAVTVQIVGSPSTGSLRWGGAVGGCNHGVTAPQNMILQISTRSQ